MIDTYITTLLTEITRVQKQKGTNTSLTISLKNGKEIVCKPFNADGTTYQKPIVSDGALILIEPFSEPQTLSDTEGGKVVKTMIHGKRTHIAIDSIENVVIDYDIINTTPVEPIVPPSEEVTE